MHKEASFDASFRDPSGFIFQRDGVIYRQVNEQYRSEYDRLVDSGLYDQLVREGLLIPHIEVDPHLALVPGAYKVVRPEPIPFISHPYEWCFGQLKDAALLTLEIQRRAFEQGMSLKDCSAYNVQFRQGKPIFIDTLSFEPYRRGEPWIAYRQFCQHFLAPLALMCYTDVRLNQLLRIYLDGVPLDLASVLLPFRTRLNFALLSHIHMHARVQRRFADKHVTVQRHGMNQMAFQGLVDSLRSLIERLEWRPGGTEWHNYYDIANYSADAMQEKERLVAKALDSVTPAPSSVWDLGANIGLFSRIASRRGILTISFDLDTGAVEENYRQGLAEGETNLLPLVLDLTNPSPGLGWENQERMSLVGRGPADVVMALALIHHLAIGNNLPFAKIAHLFGQLCNRTLIVEFVPKADPQVQKLLANRQDIFDDYVEQSFEREFARFFDIRHRQEIGGTGRTLYVMEKTL